jgi:hypothetical protein
VALGLSIVLLFITSDIARQSTMKGYAGLLWVVVVIIALVPSRRMGLASGEPSV